MRGNILIAHYLKLILFILPAILLSCNKDDVISAGGAVPVVVLENEYGVYTVKVGQELTISPEFANCDDGDIYWSIDGDIVARGPQFTCSWNEIGEVYITLTAENDYGATVEELRVDILELTPPVISLRLPDSGLQLLSGADYTFIPDIQHSDLPDFSVTWSVDGVEVCDDKTFTFNSTILGVHHIVIVASNSDGEATLDFDLEVVDTLPYSIRFMPVSYSYNNLTRYTFPGRTVYLRPVLSDFKNPVYSWRVDGKDVDCKDGMFCFTPSQPGRYRISVTAEETDLRSASRACSRLTTGISRTSAAAVAEVEVVCVDATEESRRRPHSATSLSSFDKIYEWIPAPGQFINQSVMAGSESSHADAVAWAEKRLSRGEDISLGAFGGYVVVGFDHSVAASGAEYDFVVRGNSFDMNNGIQCSNEPGIVWVMQDVNGNGLPDDQWYQLRGSEDDSENTVRDYAVTYYRPAAPGMSVQWTDNLGNEGTVDYIRAFHSQAYYYPQWIEEDAYTLYGTRLASRNYFDSTSGLWQNPPYAWGYADNVGSDSVDGLEGQCTGFKISNAMQPDGSSVELEYIDFVKIQVAVQTKSGNLGELSTEVLGIYDFNMLDR